jgi:hypothetical protein
VWGATGAEGAERKLNEGEDIYERINDNSERGQRGNRIII